MFTGIVTDIGTIEKLDTLPSGKRFRVATGYDVSSIDLGASISHAGVCLTVVEKGSGTYDVEAWDEALRLTTLGELAEGSRLNLERSLKLGDELGGHLVFGHVDGVAKILERKEQGEAVRFVIETPAHLAKFIAAKGSVALDGTSLTVNAVENTHFDILLIRHSLKVTTWGERREGELVNLEADQMARYTARLAEMSSRIPPSR